MSLKNIFLKTFLFLAFGFFGASSAFASILYYYQDRNYSCYTTTQPVCDVLFSSFDQANYKKTSCSASTGSVLLGYSQRVQTSVIDGVPTYAWLDQGTTYAGSRLSKECEGNDQITLQGCVATCAPDPCMAMKDKTVELEEICGLSQCPTGSTFSTTEKVCKNSKGATVPAQSVYSIPAAGQTESFQGCEVVSQPSPDAAGRGYFKDEELGSGELTTYCPVTYKYTGNKGSDSPDTGQNTPSTDATSPSLEDIPKLPPGLYLPEADGGCKSGDSFGQYGAGDSAIGVCVPGSDGSGDGDSGATCPATGQIKVNGTCQCTTSGYVVKNGACSAPDSNPDPNPNPDGTTCPNNLPKNPDGSCPSANTTGSGGGSYTASEKCAKAPTCSGDVVQCGLMQEAHKSKCQLLETLTGMPDGLPEKLEKIGTASNDSRIGAASGSAGNALTQLSQKIGFANSACISDVSIQVMGKTIVIPLSQVCDLLKIIRLLLHLATYFFCLRLLWSTVATV